MFILGLSTILCLTCFIVFGHTAPVRRRVFDPTILVPNAKTIWGSGTTHIVTWLTDDIPDQLKDVPGTLVLGYRNHKVKNDEHLDLKHPLASQFLLKDGKITITLPDDLPTRDDYIVVLLGDSGNTSREFTIRSTEDEVKIEDNGSDVN